MDETIRRGSVRSCKFVDELLFPAPWFPTVEFLDKENCDFTAHDALPYISEGVEDCYLASKKAGRFLPTLRTKGMSTTDILTQILRDRVTPTPTTDH